MGRVVSILSFCFLFPKTDGGEMEINVDIRVRGHFLKLLCRHVCTLCHNWWVCLPCCLYLRYKRLTRFLDSSSGMIRVLFLLLLSWINFWKPSQEFQPMPLELGSGRD